MNTEYSELLTLDKDSPPPYYLHDSSITQNPLNITIEEKLLENRENIDEFIRFCYKWGFDTDLFESYDVFKLRSKEY